MPAFQLNMLTNDAAIRVTMAAERTRQAIDTGSESFAGPVRLPTFRVPRWKAFILSNCQPKKQQSSLQVLRP